MAVVKLFQFQMYNICEDRMQPSRRRGLEGAIGKLQGAVILPASAIEVEENDVRWEDPDFPGFTPSGWFQPSPNRMS